jgi:hypothetical protein
VLVKQEDGREVTAALQAGRGHIGTAGNRRAAASFAAAIASLREHSTPYHLAHGLLDHAQHLSHLGDDKAAEAAMGEARGIAHRLGCQPLLDCADSIQPARPRTAASL